jgi:hypothetical protein
MGGNPCGPRYFTDVGRRVAPSNEAAPDSDTIACCFTRVCQRKLTMCYGLSSKVIDFPLQQRRRVRATWIHPAIRTEVTGSDARPRKGRLMAGKVLRQAHHLDLDRPALHDPTVASAEYRGRPWK